MQYKLKDNGSYKLEYATEELLEITQQYHDAVEVKYIKPYEHDSDYVMFEAYRKFNYDEFSPEENMHSDDEVYFDNYTDTYINFTDNHLCWLKVDNLEEDEEYFLSIPLAFKELDIHGYLDADRHLFDLACLSVNTFMEEHILIHATINSYYGEDENGDCRFDKVDIDEHFDSLMSMWNECMEEY